MLKQAILTILFAGLVAGTLDALAAIIVYGPVFGKASAEGIFKGIASGAFGKEAFEKGTIMASYGIAFHYFIALSFAAFYFIVFRSAPFFKKNRIAGGIAYGVFVWLVMNLLVIPLSMIKPGELRILPVITGMLILILMVGLPISFIVQARMSKSEKNR
ncbi:MAG TPA: hypothetical protein VK543_18380 [Puia sp.]|nr:hypothetical protein [Puia sp.]